MIIDIPLKQVVKTDLINLNSGVIKEIVEPLNNVSVTNGFIISNKREDVSSPIYLNKDICIEYVENISEPSVSIPTTSNFRYITKEQNSIVFKETNPKKVEVFDDVYRSSLIGTKYVNGTGIVAKKLHTKLNNYTVFELPFGGLDINDSYFYYVDKSTSTIKELTDKEVDYSLGNILIPSDVNISFIFSLCNLVPLKVLNKGLVKLDEKETNFYNIENIQDHNIVKIVSIDSENYLITFLKEVIATVPKTSLDYSIDGVLVERDQTMFFKKNETILISKILSTIKNEEYLSINTIMKEEKHTTTDKDYIHLERELDNTSDRYYIEIINKENNNSFYKNTPITITIF